MKDKLDKIPSGWYFCIESKEVKPGQVVGKYLFGQKVVFWRTKTGVINLSTSVCPHLGSDLSVLGKVDGEFLRCFSHDYTYDGNGDCVATWKKNLLPDCTKQVLRKFPVVEKNGFVLAWYDFMGRPPLWEMPNEVFENPSNAFVRSDFTFKTPLETLNEDNFDVGHLYKWHNVHGVETTPVAVAGEQISIAHKFKRHSIWVDRPLPFPLRFLTKEINSRYSSTLYGHGLTNSYIDIYTFNIYLHDLIWCTPIDANTTMYTTFLRMLPQKDSPSLVKRLLGVVLRPLVFRGSVWRLRGEHKKEGHGFWEKQTRSEVPILTSPEKALIEPYRAWSKQFYE